jgi:glucokinase
MQTIALLVDVGADACRLALLTDTGGERPSLTRYREYPVGAHASVESVIGQFLKDAGLDAAPALAGLAISGPAKTDVITITQTGWSFTRQALTEAFGFRDILVMNDNAATVLSLAWLQPQDLARLGHEGQGVQLPSAGRLAVVTPDLGLGIAAIEYDEHGYRLFDSEGGHASFAPSDPLEVQIADHLRGGLQRISWERVLSWPGLARVQGALAELSGAPAGDMRPLEVLLYGRTGADPICAKALEVVFGLLGEFAGDVALTLNALDGVFLAGRFVHETSELIDAASFRRRFENKGRMSGLVQSIPTYAVLNPAHVLLGLARAVEDRRKASAVPGRVFSGSEVSEAMLEGASSGVLVLSPELDILASNDRYWADAPVPGQMRAPGQPFAACVKAMAVCGLFGDGQPQQLVDFVLERLKSGQPFSFERILFGGRVLHERCMTTRSGAVVIVSSDVTQTRKRNHELETIAASLRESRDKAEGANRSKSQFLANMSHEIRTPMNGVLGMAEVLGRTELSSSQRGMLEIIQSSGEALLAVINDILDVSAVEAGKLTLRPRPFDLCGAVEDIAALLDARARAKGVEIAVRYRPGLPATVVADPDRLRQVITNLVGNAVKFTDEGHVLIDVDGEADSDVWRLRIAVSDTGPGIPEDKLGAVFGMFEQVDMSATRRFEGTGLGLSISQRIVEAMGGRIGVESVLGQGSTFTVEVSLRSVPGETAASSPLQSLAGRRALIVDDRPINLLILSERLQAWGMSCDEAGDGKAALAALGEGAAYDLAILDMQMPGMDGVSLARAVRKLALGKRLPLVLLTSAETGGAPDLDLFDAHLTKPARASALEAAIRQVLSPTPGVAEPPAPRPAASPPEPRLEAPSGRILIAEDHPVNVKVIEAYLADGSYQLGFARDGEEAVEAFLQERPQLVLMDISMPKLDGFEASRRIRDMEAAEGWAPTPIIALTANVMGEIRTRCREAGMDGHLAKPVKAAELLETVKRFLAPAEPGRRRKAAG